MNRTQLATLKAKMVEAKEFAEVWTYFFDEFGEDPEFISQGERTDHVLIEEVLSHVGAEIFRKPVKPHELLLTMLPAEHFIHGACMLNGHLTSILYFADIQMGMLAVAVSGSTQETKLVRFTGRIMPRSLGPSPN